MVFPLGFPLESFGKLMKILDKLCKKKRAGTRTVYHKVLGADTQPLPEGYSQTQEPLLQGLHSAFHC